MAIAYKEMVYRSKFLDFSVFEVLDGCVHTSSP